MNPLKQGLKQIVLTAIVSMDDAFIHESIKTRVETSTLVPCHVFNAQHLSMNPLKQGLKLLSSKPSAVKNPGIYP